MHTLTDKANHGVVPVVAAFESDASAGMRRLMTVLRHALIDDGPVELPFSHPLNADIGSYSGKVLQSAGCGSRIDGMCGNGEVSAGVALALASGEGKL